MDRYAFWRRIQYANDVVCSRTVVVRDSDAEAQMLRCPCCTIRHMNVNCTVQ